MATSRDSTDIFLLIGDCLRATNATHRTMPFTHDFSDIAFNWCYAPGTWTLPSHASLYSGQFGTKHDVVRRGNVLPEEYAELPKIAGESGYKTALFSENPTFSTNTGFHHGVKFVDDSIHRKPFLSSFSPDQHVEDISPRSAVTLLQELMVHENRLLNLANVAYGGLAEFQSTTKTQYPHHGRRIITHLERFVKQHDEQSVFCLANFLDTHNPHHAPPQLGAELLDIEVPKAEREALAAANDDRQYLLADDELPELTDKHFDTWDAVFDRRLDVYDAQIRHLDALIEQWATELADRLTDSLVIITGDHGQLFGEEGILGHQTSLHPHGIHVPLFVKTPDSWNTDSRTVDSPVSLTGLSAALEGVVADRIHNTTAFIDKIEQAGSVNGYVPVCADGPTWSIPELRGEYPDDAVDKFCVRKVGLVSEETMWVYRCSWDETEITRREYELCADSRELISTATDIDTDGRLQQDQRRWLMNGDRPAVDPETSVRLKQLGYM